MRDLAKERVALGIAYEADGAPLVLGDSEGGDPDLSVFPAAMAELTAAVIDTTVLEGMVGPDVPTAWTGDGVGVGGATYTGRACVAASPEEALSRLEPGDVLVTTITTPAYEAILPIAGAVVTEQGGLMGHTALGGPRARHGGGRRCRRRDDGDPRRRPDRGRPGGGPGAGDGGRPGLTGARRSYGGVRAP